MIEFERVDETVRAGLAYGLVQYAFLALQVGQDITAKERHEGRAGRRVVMVGTYGAGQVIRALNQR
ncbi:hypothetical protein BFN01_08560 [Microbacterium sp. AR7-10]|nr:hypothetical protein BFN01_08560 [Microbacterium sp. AR7-10]